MKKTKPPDPPVTIEEVLDEALGDGRNPMPTAVGDKLMLLAHLIGASLGAMQDDEARERGDGAAFVLLLAEGGPDAQGRYPAGITSNVRNRDTVRMLLTNALHSTYDGGDDEDETGTDHQVGEEEKEAARGPLQ